MQAFTDGEAAAQAWAVLAGAEAGIDGDHGPGLLAEGAQYLIQVAWGDCVVVALAVSHFGVGLGGQQRQAGAGDRQADEERAQGRGKGREADVHKKVHGLGRVGAELFSSFFPGLDA
ncbi:hypothetical protein BK640_28460 [Pseudomonas protegens]|nr:hypothetical protein BK640_28460 [Pseudomonas protegens]